MSSYCPRCRAETFKGFCWCPDCHPIVMAELHAKEDLPCGGRSAVRHEPRFIPDMSKGYTPSQRREDLMAIYHLFRELCAPRIPEPIRPGNPHGSPWDEDALGSWGRVVRLVEDNR